MASSMNGWIHSFTVNDVSTHKKGYTVYKITSIVSVQQHMFIVVLKLYFTVITAL